MTQGFGGRSIHAIHREVFIKKFTAMIGGFFLVICIEWNSVTSKISYVVFFRELMRFILISKLDLLVQNDVLKILSWNFAVILCILSLSIYAYCK